MTPLFCAVENKAPFDVVSYLIEQDKEALLLESYKLGRTPLHVAASRGASIEIIQLLMRQRPEALHEKDAWGKTPFACACAAVTEYMDEDSCQHMTAVLELLMDTSTIMEADRAGMLPLHIACTASMNLENLELLLDEYPEAICTPDHNGRLPCHAASTNSRVTVECMDVLVSAFPEALRTFDKMGALPLHIAIQRKLPREVILFLIETEEGAVRTREGSTQMYPLHLASRAGADPLILERLADIYPKAIASVDAKGNTIFHLACMQRQLTVDLAELLLDRCSYDAIRKVNEDQSLPLHLAAQYRASLPVLQLLIDHYPEALLCKDKDGNVPLHKAFQTTSPELPTLVRMAQQNHLQLSKRNKRGQLPAECASLVMQKRFRRARYWYNLRKAYCPSCIRMK
jgi:ankyrin repeat protein